MNTRQKKTLYESIMKNVSKLVKKALNESDDYLYDDIKEIFLNAVDEYYSIDWTTDKKEFNAYYRKATKGVLKDAFKQLCEKYKIFKLKPARDFTNLIWGCILYLKKDENKFKVISSKRYGDKKFHILIIYNGKKTEYEFGWEEDWNPGVDYGGREHPFTKYIPDFYDIKECAQYIVDCVIEILNN